MGSIWTCPQMNIHSAKAKQEDKFVLNWRLFTVICAKTQGISAISNTQCLFGTLFIAFLKVTSLYIYLFMTCVLWYPHCMSPLNCYRLYELSCFQKKSFVSMNFDLTQKPNLKKQMLLSSYTKNSNECLLNYAKF